MFKVLDVLKIGENTSVTFEGKCDTIQNGSILKDECGNLFAVVSVAMTRFENPSDITNSTTVLIKPDGLKKGSILRNA